MACRGLLKKTIEKKTQWEWERDRERDRDRDREKLFQMPCCSSVNTQKIDKIFI